MKNLDTFAASASASSTIRVDIFNSQYTIKPTENLSEDNIRELASYVDQRMRQVSKRGAHDTASVAVMVALNIAAEMYERHRRSEDAIRQLAQKIDEAIANDADQDSLRNGPTRNTTDLPWNRR